MAEVEAIRICTVCGGSLGVFYLCYHCGGTRPTDPDMLRPEWTCSSCSEQSLTQFACRNCGTRFLFEEVIRQEKKDEEACPSCKTPVPRGKYICLECGADLRRPQEIPVEPPTTRAPRRARGEYDEGDIRDIARIPGVGAKKAEDLCKAGYSSLWKVKNASEEELAALPEIGPEAARRIKVATNLIIVLPRIRSKDEVLDEERECKRCGLPTPLFTARCIDCGAQFDLEDLGETLSEELVREGPNALIEFYGRILTKRPNDPQLWYALGLSLKTAGRAYAAKKAIERAKKLNPTNPKFARLEQKLGAMVEEPPSALEEALLGTPRPVTVAQREPILEKPVPPLALPSAIEERPEVKEQDIPADTTCPKCGATIPADSTTCPSCSISEILDSMPSTTEAKHVEEPDAPPDKTPSEPEKVEVTKEVVKVEVVDASREDEATKVSTMVGRRPMLTGYGLVNGKGRVNGLINGNGFINGGTISEISLPRGNAVGKYATVAAILMTVFLIFNTLFVIPVEQSKSIRIDGSLVDWQSVGKYHSATSTNNPNTNITSYSVMLDGDTLFFMAEVEGVMFGNIVGTDSFYLFLDADSDNSTGYMCGVLGADYMVSVDGYDGQVAATSFRVFEGYDRSNWNNWVAGSGVSVASADSMVEGAIAAHELPLSTDSLVAKFVIDDHNGNVGESSLVVGLNYGALEITQRSLTNILPAGMTEFLELTFRVAGAPVSLDHDDLVISHSAGTIVDISPPSFTVTEGHPLIAHVMIDASILPTGDVVEAYLSSVRTDLPVTVNGGPARGYVVNMPTQKRIDGLFRDWPSPIPDSMTIGRDDSLDIEAYDANITGQTAFFYMRTVATSLRGAFAPVMKVRYVPSPGGGGTQQPPQRVTGESTARVYLDTDPTNYSGFFVNGIRAKYLLEAKGHYGTLRSIYTYRWEGRWVIFSGSPKFAKGDREMEMSLLVPSADLGNCSYVIETSDWRGLGERTLLGGTRSGHGARTRGGFVVVTGSATLMYALPTTSAPTIDGDWSATEWQDADSYSTGDIIIYTMQNGTYLFIALRVLADSVYNAGDYAEVAFDTDNGDEAGPDQWDKMFNATDPDGSTVNQDYNGNGTEWNASYVSPYTWSANGMLDADSGNYVTYEFAIPFQEVWNTSNPSPGQLAGLAVHAHDANASGADYYWGSSNLNSPITYGHVEIPEFEDVIVVLVLTPVIAIMVRRRGKINKQRGH